MNESALNALINLFAIFSIKGDKDYETARGVLEEYLNNHLGIRNPEEYLSLFYEIFDLYNLGPEFLSNEKTTQLVTRICEQVKGKIHHAEQVIILLRFLELAADHLKTVDEGLYKTAADIFEISSEDFDYLRQFIFSSSITDLEGPVFLVVNNQSVPRAKVLHLQKEGLTGDFVVLYLSETKQFLFKYLGTDPLLYEGLSIRPNRFYVFNHGSIIRGQLKTNIYYTEVSSLFFNYQFDNALTFSADQAFYQFPKSKNGIQPFTFSEPSGQLIAVMGGSGVGKSTLLNLLNGEIKPVSGSIRINSFDIHKDYDQIEGLIGYIPQDDLVIEELTVYQNISYNARLCLDKLSKEELEAQIDQLLKDLDLYEIRHMVVGNPLKKTLSGGQRKRLNIGLELIREPAILFVDEPTSGLSSKDSEKIMILLKQQAQRGRLVIVNIHQPSSFIYKLFDKLWIMDKGGYPIYQGNPIDAIVYFKEIANHIDADSCECVSCGNVNPEQVLEIVESQRFDESGKLTQERQFSPQELYELYQDKIQRKINPAAADSKGELDARFSKPVRIKQFGIFFSRNLQAKLSNRQYVILNLLQAPLLALVVALLTRYSGFEGYFFGLNKNFPSFLFMSIVVMLFQGMSISAEEIIRDRFILKRESFLRLSRLGYLNSKIIFLLSVSLIQSFLFTVVSYWILGIPDLFIRYWLILFLTAAFANLAGLNISAGLDSVVTIYISIPLLIIPQILLCGLIVDFDDIQPKNTDQNRVPIVGDIMVSRWAFEALAVDQFTHNEYTANYFWVDKEMSEYLIKSELVIPELVDMINTTSYNLATGLNQSAAFQDLAIIAGEIKRMDDQGLNVKFNYQDQLLPEKFTRTIGDSAVVHLRELEDLYKQLYASAERYRDGITASLIDSLGREELVEMRKFHENEAMKSLLQKDGVTDYFKKGNTRLLVRVAPIYQDPVSRAGRAHFYAPVKFIGNQIIDTYTFNVMVIILMLFVLYIALYFNWLRKVIYWSKSWRAS